MGRLGTRPACLFRTALSRWRDIAQGRGGVVAKTSVAAMPRIALPCLVGVAKAYGITDGAMFDNRLLDLVAVDPRRVEFPREGWLRHDALAPDRLFLGPGMAGSGETGGIKNDPANNGQAGAAPKRYAS